THSRREPRATLLTYTTLFRSLDDRARERPRRVRHARRPHRSRLGEHPMRILVVHQYYLGPGEPGGSRFNELARMWTRSGHHVTIIAGNLNYVTGRPTVADGRWVIRRDEDGIDV